MKHVFIVNPVSGVGAYKQVLEWVSRHFQRENFEIHVTKYPGHARNIASMYGKGNIIYAVGGDGTAFEVINGMDFENEFALIPVGTGNDFFKSIDYDKPLEDLLYETVFDSQTCMVDIGQVNDHYFLNFASLGLDANVNYRAEKLKGKKFIPRKSIYLVSALPEIVKIKPTHIELYNEEINIKKDISLLSIMNGSFYGGSFHAAPNASLVDGLLDVCIVDPLTRSRAAVLMPKYIAGTHENLKEVTMLKLKGFTIDSPTPFKYAADGEVFESDSITIRIHEKMLKYRLPNSVVLKSE